MKNTALKFEIEISYQILLLFVIVVLKLKSPREKKYF